MKKLIALLLTISMLFSVTVATAGCGKGGQLGDGDDVIIRFHLDNLGYGTQWLAESCERFMEQQKDVEYPGGKKGVYCHIIRGNTPTAANLGGSTSHVVFSGGYGDTLAETGNVMNIDDIVKMEIPGEGKTIEDKMYPETRGNYRAGDTYDEEGTLIPGDYYTVPTHEIYAGISYDKKVFDKYGFYFARRLDGDEVPAGNGNPDFSVYDYDDYFGVEGFRPDLTGDRYYFLSPKPLIEEYNSEAEYLADVEAWEEGKSCGPNGIYGDYDDGLPSSLYELFALWKYMKGTVSPLLVSGFQQSLANTFLDAIPMSLMGYDKARGQFNLTGEVDAVVNFAYNGLANNDYSSDNVGVKNGLSYIEAPVIQNVEVTEESGYYTTWAVERYLTMAMMEVLVHEGFLDAASYPNKKETLNHLFSQKKFINSGHRVSGGSGVGPEVAMLAEYSYWWNESSIRGNLTSFNKLNPTVEDREIRWMPLPVNIKTSVTGQDETVSFKFTEEGGPSFTRTGTEYTESKKGEKNLLVQTSNNTLVLNKKAISNGGSAVKQAVTDWMLFFHSDKELSAVTASQGFRKGLQYEMKDEDISNWATFYQDLYTLSEKSDIIRLGADNETFGENATTIFSRGEGNKAWKCSHTDYFGCWRNTSFGQKGRNSCTCFIYTMITKKEWETYYKGGKDLDKIETLLYEDGGEITFVNGDGGQPW